MTPSPKWTDLMYGREPKKRYFPGNSPQEWYNSKGSKTCKSKEFKIKLARAVSPATGAGVISTSDFEKKLLTSASMNSKILDSERGHLLSTQAEDGDSICSPSDNTTSLIIKHTTLAPVSVANQQSNPPTPTIAAPDKTITRFAPKDDLKTSRLQFTPFTVVNKNKEAIALQHQRMVNRKITDRKVRILESSLAQMGKQLEANTASLSPQKHKSTKSKEPIYGQPSPFETFKKLSLTNSSKQK